MNKISESKIKRFKEFCANEVPNLIPPVSERQKNLWTRIPDKISRKTDVLIYGAGISGFTAAIATRRRGYNAIIVEPTHMVGGQATSAGVSAFDITFHYDHLLNDFGIWSELVSRIIAFYESTLNRPVNVGHYRNISLTPNAVIVERVMTEMLDEAGVEVLRNTDAIDVIYNKGRISGLDTTAGNIQAAYTIDASEDGSVLALAGVPHRLSNGFSNGTSEWGITSPTKAIQDITYTATIRKYPTGVPESLRIAVAPPKFQELLPILRQRYPAEGILDDQKKKIGPNGFAGFRAAPDLATNNMQTGAQWDLVTRTNLNYYNDFSVSSDFLTNLDYRLRAEAEAKLLTISIIYYLQNYLGLPWGVVTDEGFAEGPKFAGNKYVPNAFRETERHMPLIPYIREGRRLVGLATITGKNIKREPNRSEASWSVNSVAVGTYHPDLHGGRKSEDFESHLNEGLDDKPTTWREGPFPIPLGTLIPAWTDGLIAAEKNISTSRLANGAIRLHPTVASIGEAAASLACCSISNDIEPRFVLPSIVQYDLAKFGSALGPLSIAGINKNDKTYPEVALAVARNRVAFTIVRPAGKEPFISVDLKKAAAAGNVTLKFMKQYMMK